MSEIVEVMFWASGLFLLACGLAGFRFLLQAIVEEVRIWKKKHPKVKSRVII